MTPADLYRVKAAGLSAKARHEKNSELKTEFERLALSYVHLAELADRNSRTDIVYETPPKHARGSSRLDGLDPTNGRD